MRQKLILIMGIISILFGCDKRESLGGHYYLNEKENIIQYRYSVGGALRWYYTDLNSADIKTFKVFSNTFATDQEHIYFAGKPVKGISPDGFQIVEEFPSAFAKNIKSKQILYRDSLIDIDFQTAKIHSTNYVSDNKTVIYIAKKGASEFGQFHKVPATDAASFQEFKSKSENGTGIGYDKHHIYLNGINTKISSSQAQIIQLGLPTIILQNDTLHYIYSSYRKKESLFKDLQLPFKANAHGVIDTFIYDDFYHFSVQGFKKSNQIDGSKWITDEAGLYFVYNSRIHKVTDKQFEQYIYDPKHPRYLRTTDSLYQVQRYPLKTIRYSSKAEIVAGAIVKDQNNIYQKGEEIKNADSKTFSELPHNQGFVDKNFYYSRMDLSSKKPIPSWAYQEFLEGKKTNDLFGTDLKYDHTVYKTYWNGFLVSLSVPTKQNNSDTIQLEFKNIARKTIALKTPLEQQLHILYQPNKTLSPVYYGDRVTPIRVKKAYNYTSIKNEESIAFSFKLNHQMITQNTVITNGNSILPNLILSNKEFVLERNEYDLYIQASTN